MAKKPEIKYLLELSYPASQHAMGLFDTTDEALAFAAANPPPHQDDLSKPGPVGDRYKEGPWVSLDHGVEENGVPQGYCITQFVGGVPVSWANVSPYESREIIFPGSEKSTAIDPEQELDWN